MLLYIWAAWMSLASEALPNISIAGEPSDAGRSCTVDELLPLSTSVANARSSEWSEQNAARDPYGCDCSFSRARCVRRAERHHSSKVVYGTHRKGRYLKEICPP